MDKEYFVFRIQGDCDLLKSMYKVLAPDARVAIRTLWAMGELGKDFGGMSVNKFIEQYIDKGKRVGGDLPVLSFLPWMEDSWQITNESYVSVAAIEPGQLFIALITTLSEMKKNEEETLFQIKRLIDSD